MTHSERMARHAQLSQTLARLSEPQMAQLMSRAEPLGSGIGGATFSLALEGQQVFVKRVRLTDLERRPENRLSTANLFGLPTFCQRNVGSVGFGVWRELAAHTMTTGWVLAQQLESFPLMHHWRVLEDAAAAGAGPLPSELIDIEAAVGHWGGAEAMGRRLQALAAASASVMIFMERLPWTLSAWLKQQLAAGPDALEAACAMVDHGLTVDVPRMNALGLLHGDAHFDNILTDGQGLCFADLGLAMSESFALSADELGYLRHHASLDRAYVLARWTAWLVQAFVPAAGSAQERMALVRAVAQGEDPHRLMPALPSCAAALLIRHAPTAAVVDDFYVKLHREGRDAPYPREEIEALLSGLPAVPGAGGLSTAAARTRSSAPPPAPDRA
ncbi:hypothetical protein [Rubrivivax rivuli]|uniref:hypothetical protein n=1 Tax=Rubrivivax rivuli TaxID=1862385 RepID=UPI00196A48B1|nr:hypothetical protein [Rubrivivax rivuli]